MDENLIPNDYLGAKRTRQSEEFIPNDSFGMAQDLRRMKERVREWWRIQLSCNSSIDPAMFVESIIEFENYCLNQHYEV